MKPDNSVYSSREHISERIDELRNVLERLRKHGSDTDAQRYRLNMIILGMQDMLDKKLPSDA